MPWLWNLEKDRIGEIWRDIGRVERRLNELRVPNTQEDIQQWMNKCLYNAARDGQFAVCEYLLRNGGDPTREIIGVLTAIHLAAMCNHSRLLQLFMDGSWPPDVTDIYGLTSLWWAGYKGHKDCVEILLSRGADPLYERTQSHNNHCFLENGVSCDDSPVAAATKCHHGDIVAMMQDIIKARAHPFVQQIWDERDKLKIDLAKRDVQLKAQDEKISALECQLKVCQTRIVSLEEQLKCAVEGSNSSRLREEISYLKGERSAMRSEIQHLRSLSHTSTLQTASSSIIGDANITCHSSALPPHVSSPSLDPQHVLSVVQQQSSCRWYPLGRAMGLSSDQLHMFASRFVFDCDKLQAVFDEKAREVGEVAAANMLLQACRSIQNPTIGAIEQELKKQCGCSSL